MWLNGLLFFKTKNNADGFGIFCFHDFFNILKKKINLNIWLFIFACSACQEKLSFVMEERAGLSRTMMWHWQTYQSKKYIVMIIFKILVGNSIYFHSVYFLNKWNMKGFYFIFFWHRILQKIQRFVIFQKLRGQTY